MKKIICLFVMMISVFVFLGTVNAADWCADGTRITVNAEEISPNTTDADGYDKISITTLVNYTMGTTINVTLTKRSGVDHFTTELISTYFEVVSDTHINGESIVLRAKDDLPAGKYDIAKVKIYHKSVYDGDDDCIVVPNACLNESHMTCENSDGTHYYNDLGRMINESEYGYYCAEHKCESYTFKADTDTESTTVYYGPDGVKVDSEEAMINACKCRHDKDTNKYYGPENTEIDEKTFDFVCNPHSCTAYEYEGKTYYYNSEGVKVDTEEEMIANCKCRHDVTTNKYYGLKNEEITEQEYKDTCLCRTEEGKDGKIYYCKLGELCTKEEFENKCPEPTQTGATLPIALVAGGLAIAGGAVFLTSRKNKFGRI